MRKKIVKEIFQNIQIDSSELNNIIDLLKEKAIKPRDFIRVSTIIQVLKETPVKKSSSLE
jgi:hypothetical protein